MRKHLKNAHSRDFQGIEKKKAKNPKTNTEAFRDFEWFFDSKLNLESATTFSRYKLLLFYDNFKVTIECIFVEDLPLCNGSAILTDIWTSRNSDPYQSMTLHYIKSRDKSGNLCFMLNNLQINN